MSIFGFPFRGQSPYIARLNLNRAVFLDRDGTLIQEMEYLSRPDQIAFFPGVGRALRGLRQAGFKLFIVSNQSGVGRGLFTLADVGRVHARLVDELAAEDARIDKIYVAPEAPGAPSRGRKPLPQFLFDARDEFQLDLSQSYFIGDKLIDLQCGWNAGVKKSILVRTGYGRELEQTDGGAIAAAIVVDDLAAAAAWILQKEAADKTVATR
jgi:D,D-heptose 1,7-bisphosphate phosphatase